LEREKENDLERDRIEHDGKEERFSAGDSWTATRHQRPEDARDQTGTKSTLEEYNKHGRMMIHSSIGGLGFRLYTVSRVTKLGSSMSGRFVT